MPTVRIAYDPNDLKAIGTLREVDEATARQLIRDGRAVRVDPPELSNDDRNTKALDATGREVKSLRHGDAANKRRRTVEE